MVIGGGCELVVVVVVAVSWWVGDDADAVAGWVGGWVGGCHRRTLSELPACMLCA